MTYKDIENGDVVVSVDGDGFVNGVFIYYNGLHIKVNRTYKIKLSNERVVKMDGISQCEATISCAVKGFINV